MKILQINASYKPAYIYGGPTMSVSKLSEQLTLSGCMVQVYTTTANGNVELDVAPGTVVDVSGVPVTYFQRITKDHSHFSPRLLVSVWQHSKIFDVIHIHAWWNTVSVLSCLLAIMRGKKVIISPRGTLSNYSFQYKNAFYKKIIHYFLGRPLLNKCAIHVTSAHEEAAIHKLIQAKQIINILNFVNLPATLPVSPVYTGDVLNLIFLSRIDQKKGLGILIRALAEITRPYHLTIAGTGDPDYIESLKAIAQQLQVDKNITWAGFQSDHKYALLAAHHLLVLPSQDENFGNVVIESLSVGTAVLVSEHVGLADYVTNKQTGWVSPNQATAFAQVINSIKFEQLAAIREKAPAMIRYDFNATQLLQQYLTMYQTVIKNG